MEIPNHKLFLREEFFGSIIYNTAVKNYFNLDKASTKALERILIADSKKIKNKDLVDFKEDLLKAGLFSSNISVIKKAKKDSLSAPIRVFIDITHKCNLRCKHCFTDSGKFNPDELTTQQIFNLLDQMQKNGAFLFSIAGGEPLLRSDIFQIIEYARNKFIDVSLTTNGILITEEVAKKFDALKLRTITVSIDGLKHSHEQVRGLGNFDRAIKGIKTLRRFCKSANISMKVTVNSLNVGQYKELIKLSENLSLDSIKFNPIRLFGRTANSHELLITQEQYIEFLEDIQKVKTKINVTIPKTPLDNINYEFIDCGFGCTGGKETCNIDPSGNFSACAFLGNDYVVGNIKNETFSNLWNKAKKSTNYAGNDSCLKCSEYKNCRGGCRSRGLFEYGNINSIDPFCTLRKNEPEKRITIRHEKDSLIVYNHSTKKYEEYDNFREITAKYSKIIKNKQFREIWNNFKVPLKIFSDPTNKCNSKCIHCYNNSGKGLSDELNINSVGRIAVEMRDLGIFQVAIAGGEPFLMDNIFEIIKVFNQNDIDVSITSNGLCLTKDKVDMLKDVYVKSITISIDGVDRNKYKEIRGVDGFEKLNENLKYLRKKFLGELSMRFSVMKNNCEPKKVIEYTVSKGFDCLKINKTHLLGRFNKNKKYLMNNEEYDDIIKQFDKLSKNYSIELELPREKYFNEKNKFLCSAGKKTIYIAPDGKVFPCPFIPEKFLFGKLNKDTLSKIIFNNKLFTVDNAFCRACPAMNKSHNITKKKLI